MLSLNALSLAPDVNDWLANTRQPRILHVFDRACNLINERREVLSIVTPQIGNGPFNLVIPGFRKPFERFSDMDASRQTSEVFANINLQSAISTSPNQLTLGHLTITTQHAAFWSPRPDWEMLHARRENILYQLTKLPIMANAAPSSGSPRGTNYQLPILQFSTPLISSLANADLQSCLTAARKLAGLGNGLTPSGDDFLLGAIYAAWIIHPYKIASVLVQKMANIAAPLTTTLSAAWLRSAGKGDAGILWHNFFNALMSDDTSAIELQITKLLSVGHTSGADALTGFIDTFKSWRDLAHQPIKS